VKPTKVVVGGNFGPGEYRQKVGGGRFDQLTVPDRVEGGAPHCAFTARFGGFLPVGRQLLHHGGPFPRRKLGVLGQLTGLEDQLIERRVVRRLTFDFEQTFGLVAIFGPEAVLLPGGGILEIEDVSAFE